MKVFDAQRAGLEGRQLIEASAGTGKTFTIALLYVRLILERGLHPETLLVVTYTRAATAELRRRIRERLEQACATLNGDKGLEENDPLAKILAGRGAADLPRLRRALVDFDRAAIFTIHGFAQRVLQELAFDGGEALDLELIEDERPLLEEVYVDFISRYFHRLPPRVAEALEPSKDGHDKLRAFARTVVQRQGAPLPPPPTPPPLHDALERWHAARERAQDELDVDRIYALLTSRAMNGSTYRKDTLRKQLEQLLACRSPDELAVKHLLKCSTGALRTKKNHEPPSDPFFDAARDWYAAHEALSRVLDSARYALRHALARYARDEMERRLAERGLCTFDALLRKVDEGLARSPELVERLRIRYRAGLIDEFQDTDPVQYRIFERVFGEASLFLIGDPKQAIYAFRGADVFAYLQAAQDVGEDRASLATNFRSDPSVLKAVETLFRRDDDPFVQEGVEFVSVVPSPQARDRVTHDPHSSAALQILTHAGMRGGAELTHETSARLIVRLVSSEMRLELDPRDGGPRRVRPGDFAVLCRTNTTALGVQEALRNRGIPAVFRGDRSVFGSETASDLIRLIVAVLEPHRLPALRAAVLTPLCGESADVLLADADGDNIVEHARRLLEARRRWRAHGVMRALRYLFDEYAVERRLLERRDGERRLTDLLHIAELLHHAEHERRLGPERLAGWFHQAHASSEDSTGSNALQMRLESDAEAVQLYTIHTSKGLQFPLVVCPDLHSTPFRPCREHFPREYHEHGASRLEFDMVPPDDVLEAAQREYDAENRRLLYVALTRARHRIYVPWVRTRNIEHSPLAALLHEGKPADGDELVSDIDALARESGGSIARLDAAALEDMETDEPASGRVALGTAREARRSVQRERVVTSYSRWVKESNEAHFAGRDLDRAIDTEEARAPLLPSLPAGAATGLLVHSVLERVDFGDLEGLEQRVQEVLHRFGQPERYTEELLAVVRATARAPLPLGLHRSATLAEARAGVPEMELTLAFAPDCDWRERLEVAMRAEGGLFAAYASRLSELAIEQVGGFVRGYIDWIGEVAGYAIVVDYKSNLLLGGDYGPDALARAMIDHHYPTQALVYLAACRRHLARCGVSLPLGGAHYLFLRGLEHGGVASLHPSADLLDCFEAVLLRRGDDG